MQLISTARVAEKLSVSGRTVRNLLKAGELPALRVGRCLRFREEDVDAFIGRRCATNLADPNQAGKVLAHPGQHLLEGKGEEAT